MGGLHGWNSDIYEPLGFFFWHFKDQLIMDLQEQSSALHAFYRAWHFNHGAAHDICGSALNGRVYGLALGECAGHLVGIANAFNVAFAAHDGGDISIFTRFGFRLFHIIFDAGEFFKIGFDVGARFAAAYPDIFGKTKSRNTVDNAKVNRLSITAHFGRHFRQRDTEHLTRSQGVNIDAIRKSLFHGFQIRNMGK